MVKLWEDTQSPDHLKIETFQGVKACCLSNPVVELHKANNFHQLMTFFHFGSEADNNLPACKSSCFICSYGCEICRSANQPILYSTLLIDFHSISEIYALHSLFQLAYLFHYLEKTTRVAVLWKEMGPLHLLGPPILFQPLGKHQPKAMVSCVITPYKIKIWCHDHDPVSQCPMKPISIRLRFVSGKNPTNPSKSITI